MIYTRFLLYLSPLSPLNFLHITHLFSTNSSSSLSVLAPHCVDLWYMYIYIELGPWGHKIVTFLQHTRTSVLLIPHFSTSWKSPSYPPSVPSLSLGPVACLKLNFTENEKCYKTCFQTRISASSRQWVDLRSCVIKQHKSFYSSCECYSCRDFGVS